MNSIKNGVVFWNCGGGIRSKIDFIDDFIARNEPSVFFISENEIKPEDIRHWNPEYKEL